MTSKKKRTRRRSKPVSVPIPRTRDPFVNTPLLSLGLGPEGKERFWTSTWNNSAGPTGVVVDEDVSHEVYRFDRSHRGFYSAVMEDDDTLWLCGDLSKVVRLSLSTGRYECFQTGLPSALVFQGMILDPATRKLFALAFPSRTMAFSFDLRKKKTVMTYGDFTPGHYMRCSFPNGDGTYSAVVHIPGEYLVRWDPARESLDAVELRGKIESHPSDGASNRVIRDGQGKAYFPHLGWYDPKRRRLSRSGPKPHKEATWFALRDEKAYGVVAKGNGSQVVVWNLNDSTVKTVCHIPDNHQLGVNLSESGKIIAVNIYGVAFRFDAESGALECSRVLPVEAIGNVDCVCRIDKDRLLGTPFITQRFWEVDLKTGKGVDCGRAAPGAGEVLQTWKIGKKVYMAAYTGGELVEYDPGKHPHFPENPRVVADPPGGMRPVAAATDGRNIYYACSAPYGSLGSVLTRYDTRTGLAQYARNPIPAQQIQSLYCMPRGRSLYCGTTIHSDCLSCPPTATVARLAHIDADTLAVREDVTAPESVPTAWVIGPLNRYRLLVLLFYGSGEMRWAELALRDFSTPEDQAIHDLPEGCARLRYAGKPGLFVMQVGRRIELWDMRKPKCLEVLFEGRGVRNAFYNYLVQDGSLYVLCPKQIIVIDGALPV